MMDVSAVIAAWGEGVNVCLCPPSPSSNRSLIAQNARKNNNGWGPWTRPYLPRATPPPPRQIGKKTKY